MTTIVTVHLGAAALAAAQPGGLAPLWAAGLPTAAVSAFLVISFAVGFLVAGYHMALALRPNLQSPKGSNRFGLVRAAETTAALPPACVKTQLEEIRLLIEALKAVALHRRY
ncbi:hypothetical protein AB0M44_34055 [Streptosporangium subroseum]|uniref:hypothetical protein n=1 Tax=Streptosporangium subroseum TaxID=106412 RepID=UPI003419972B